MNSTFLTTLSDAWSEFLHRLLQIVPDLLVLASIVGTGVVAGWACRWVIGRLLQGLHFDSFADRCGLAESTRRAGLREPPRVYLSNLVGWSVMILFLLVGTASLRIPGTENLVSRGFEFLPSLLAAIVILTTGFLLAQFFARATLIAAVNAEIESARLLSTAVRILVGLLSVAMTLEQIGVARGVVTAAFSILFGGIVLGFSLAFGFGGRHLARRFLERKFSALPREKAGNELQHL